MTEGRAARDGSDMHACPRCSRCRPTRSFNENLNKKDLQDVMCTYCTTLYLILTERLLAYWTCILYICYLQSYMNIECLYFSTLHSFLFFTTCFSFSYLFIFFFMHYWWGCKAKLIWCLLLCLLLLVFLMFNCYPPYFREFLFLLKW